MSYFDEWESKDNENKMGDAPAQDNEAQAGNESAAPPEADAQDVSATQAGASAQAETPSAPQGQGEQTERSSVSYTPEDRYTPHREIYTPREPMPNYEEKPPKKRFGVMILCAVLAVALLAGTFFGGTMIGKWYLADNPPAQGAGGTGGGTPTGGSGNQGSGIDRGDVVLNVVESVAGLTQEGSVSAVVEAVQNAVVEIRTETAVNDPFYGNYVESGAGSGVIISQDGLILTCNHVIEGAESITVTLASGDKYTATLLGADSWSDLALLQIEGTDFAYATLAKAPEGAAAYSYMKVGETAIAIGNPLGELGGSVSSGIISALGREVTVEGMPMTLLQTDASVNPGNSGGGLFNLSGELIGIVNAKSTGEAVEGIGFAIPSVDAIEIVKQLYKQGYVSGRPYLGLHFQATNYGLQIVNYEYNDELTGGTTVKSGDYLQYVDGITVDELSDLTTILAGKTPGDTVVIQVSRLVGTFGFQSRYESIEITLTVHEYVPVLSNEG